MKTPMQPLLRAPAADPVCGEHLDPAQKVIQMKHNGLPVYFCSRKCLKAFKVDPERYGYPKRKGFWRRYVERLEKATAENPQACRG